MEIQGLERPVPVDAVRDVYPVPEHPHSVGAVLQKMHLYGSIPGLIFVHVVYGIPITTLIFRNYYAAIPTELVEASKIDGAGILGIYRLAALPTLLVYIFVGRYFMRGFAGRVVEGVRLGISENNCSPIGLA